MGIDEVGIDKIGIDKVGINRPGNKAISKAPSRYSAPG